jgi:hypothetical protein
MEGRERCKWKGAELNDRIGRKNYALLTLRISDELK